jgi:beta-glucosidase
MAHRAIKAASSHATVGSAYGMEPGFPRTNTETDREAVRRFEAIRNRLFFHAALTGEYPDAFVGEIPHEAMGFRSGDEKILKVPFDWLGVHYYCRLAVSAPDQPPAPRGGAKTPDPHGQFRVGLFNEGESTDGGLEIWPTGLYDLLTSLAREVGNLPIEITETGGVYRDGPGSDGAVHDSRRIDWYRQHLIQLHRAIAAGANVRAYHAWSLLDNFEWHSGYTQRYGLTWVDFATQRRIIKDSGLWLSRVARENRLV